MLEKYKGGRLVSIEFRSLIDKEDIMVDSKRLEEWRNNAGKFELFKKIDEVRDRFVDDNVNEYDWEVMTLLVNYTEKIKSIL